MPKLTEYELEREANIARNRALLEELDIKGAISQLGLPASGKNNATAQAKVKPVQPRKPKRAREEEVPIPRRQSKRLKKDVIDPNESPGKRRRREKEAEILRKKEEEERLEAEERAREARMPRHQNLDPVVMGDDMSPVELQELTATLKAATATPQPKRIGKISDYVFDDSIREKAEVKELREKLQNLKVVSRAKVTQDRIYSAAYHPEKTKDLIFFGDKHGQLGIWDPLAVPDDVEDEDGDVAVAEDGEGGKHWRLQPHWPATSKSSISTVKFDPVDSHSVFTTSYDCSVRSTSFTTGLSREILFLEDMLITSIDLPSTGQEMWVSDAEGGVTHLDLREDKFKARRWELAQHKIGCVSINPTDPVTLLTASNNRTLKIWDARKLQSMPINTMTSVPLAQPLVSAEIEDNPTATTNLGNFEFSTVQEFLTSDEGNNTLRANWEHGMSVSSAFWDPRGRSIVSTSYDNTLRLWEMDVGYTSQSVITSKDPFCRIRHNCQTGKWLTILKAQWSQNPDVYPHFTIGNMKHSLDIFSCKGELLARLSNQQLITAVQAVTCSHPSIVERAASGNGSGRCILWAPKEG